MNLGLDLGPASLISKEKMFLNTKNTKSKNYIEFHFLKIRKCGILTLALRSSTSILPLDVQLEDWMGAGGMVVHGRPRCGPVLVCQRDQIVNLGFKVN